VCLLKLLVKVYVKLTVKWLKLLVPDFLTFFNFDKFPKHLCIKLY